MQHHSFTVDGTPSTYAYDELSLHFKGIFAEYERTQITERCRRGRNYRAKLGNVSVISNAPYGYVYRKRNPPENAAYVIDDIKAEIVRKIYRWYVQEGKSIKRMALELGEQGIKPPRGGQKWHNSTVRDILRNPAYTGTAYFGKSENNEGFSDKIIYTKSGKKKCPPKSRKMRDKDTWTEISVPAIIDKTEFELAQKQLDRNKQLSSRNTQQPSLLQGVLICGNCGHPYYRKVRYSANPSQNYYACGDRLNGGVCKNRSFKQIELDDAIWDYVIGLMKNPSLIEEEIRNRTLESNDEKHTATKRRDIEKELLRLDKAKDKLLEAYQYGECLTVEELQKRVKAMEKQRIMHENELKGMQAQLLQKENCIVLKENMKHFLESLERSNKLSTQERQKVIRLLVDEIRLSEEKIEIMHCIPISSDSGDFSQNVLLRPDDFNLSPWCSHECDKPWVNINKRRVAQRRVNTKLMSYLTPGYY